MCHFFYDVDTIEDLNEPVHYAGSEQEVSKTEYSPSETESNSGIWSLLLEQISKHLF